MGNINEIIPRSAIDSITNTNTAINILDNSTLEFVKTVTKLSESLKKGGVSLKEINTAKKASEEITKQQIKLQKEQESAEKSLATQRKKALTQIAKVEAAKKKEVIAIEKAGKATLKSIGQESLYFKAVKKSNAENIKKTAILDKIKAKEDLLNTAINKVIKSEKDLADKTAALTAKRYNLDKTTKQGAIEFKRLTAEIYRNNIALQKSQASTGLATRGVGKYAGAIRGVGMQLMGALGITAGLYGFVRAMSSAIKTSKDFEKQTAVLAGVLDVQVNETKSLTKQAVELGGIYPTMAKEVLNLQTAYARLGFTQKEIIDLTESTIVGSFSLNASLEDTALLVGAVVKSYDELGASDAGMIIDQLTKSTQKSSLNFEALSTALPKVAGAANALNISLSTTLANLGSAIDATQDASIAGTSYRKILLSNAKANRTLDESLQIINNSTNKVSTAQTLFGDRAAIVGLALANNVDKTKELANEIENSLGVAQRDADKKMNTFAGSVDSVSSSWERLVLKMNTSNGALKTFMDLTASFLTLLGGFTSVNPFKDMEVVIETNTALYKKALDNFSNLSKFASDEEKEFAKTQVAFYKKALDSFQWYIDEKEQGEKDAVINKEISLKELLLTEETDVRKQVQLLIDIENLKNKQLLASKKHTTDELEIIELAHQQKIKDIEASRYEAIKQQNKKNAGAQLQLTDDLIEEEQEIIGDGYDQEYLANKEKNEKIESDEQELSDKLQEIRDGNLDAQLEALDEEDAAREQKQSDDLERAQQLSEAKIALVKGAIDGAFDIYQGGLERESIALQTKRDYELQLAGDNKEQQAKINEKYDKLQAKIRTKQAKADKAAAMVTIATQAAIAIVSAYSTPPAPVGLALGLIMGALAAVQIGVVASQPIPKFFKGTTNAPGGIISVAEKGGELIHKKTGEMLYAPKQTNISGVGGATIYTKEQTEKIFAASGHDSSEIKELTKINKRVVSALENQTHYSFQTDRVIKSKGNYRKTWRNVKLAR